MSGQRQLIFAGFLVVLSPGPTGVVNRSALARVLPTADSSSATALAESSIPPGLLALMEEQAPLPDRPIGWECPSRYATGFWLLPSGLIYRSYLAGPKEPRLAGAITHLRRDSTMLDGTLGARVGLFRIGTSDSVRPRGFQLDVEGATQVRLDLEEEWDVRSADFRAGVPFTWGNERRQWKFAYYHISSHLGDEFLIKNPEFPVFFQARDALVLGYSHYLIDWLRVYAEAGWAFYSHASEPWEFQFGLDAASREPTGLRGAPFVAVNGLLRQEHNFGGSLTVQTGWAWRSDVNARLLRTGLQYHNGASSHFAFLPYYEQQLGFGIWYDF